MALGDQIHQVCCSLTSDPASTEQFVVNDEKCRKLVRYARRLGFAVMYENVDREG